MNYLSEREILLLHDMVIEASGGSHGLRDHKLIHAVVELPKQSAFGSELYPAIFVKSAVYVRNIVMIHPFVDGNKRTAMVSAGVFLEDNGYMLTATDTQLEDFAVSVATQSLEISDIARWLEKNSKKPCINKKPLSTG